MVRRAHHPARGLHHLRALDFRGPHSYTRYFGAPARWRRKAIRIELLAALAGAITLARTALVTLIVCGLGSGLVSGLAVAAQAEPEAAALSTGEAAQRTAPLARGVTAAAVTPGAPRSLTVGYVSSVQHFVQEESVATTLPAQVVRDATLEVGKQVLVSAAVAGETVRTWQIRAVDGREAGRTLISEQVVRAPVAEVSRVGTKPKPPPPPRPAPPAPAVIEKIIRDAAAKWGADPEQLLRVAWCESRFDPNAFNPTASDSGLFQFIPETWRRQSPRAGYAGASPFDPVAAANTAAMLFAEGQARLWMCK